MNTICGLRFFRAVALLMTATVGTTAGADDPANTARDQSQHPASWTLRFLTTRYDHIRKHIRDYSCRQIKRERINGNLQEYQFAWTLVRCEQPKDSQVVHPLSVFMHFYAPAGLEDRRVLFVDGRNKGMMRVRKGGQFLNSVVLSVDPFGAVAKLDSNYPITNNSFDIIVERLMEQVSNTIKSDPAGSNTKVSHFANASVGDRVCTHIQLLHPKPLKGIKYHKSSWYFDDELHVPIRVANYDWPEKAGDEPPVMEEYMYVGVQTNIGLKDADFSDSKLN